MVVQQSAALGCAGALYLDRTRLAYSPLVNDEAAFQHARQVAAEMLGEENVIQMTKPLMYAEDFSMYLGKIPGAFLMVGAGNSTPPHTDLHSPYFFANEGILPIGAALHSSLAVSYLQLAAADRDKVSTG